MRKMSATRDSDEFSLFLFFMFKDALFYLFWKRIEVLVLSRSWFRLFVLVVILHAAVLF